MRNKLTLVLIIAVLLFNLLVPVIYAAMPDFSIVTNNITEEKDIFKTDESSVETVADPKFSFQSESQYLIESSTGEVIYANNENKRLLPASVTKIMTLLLVMDEIDGGNLRYDDTVTCSAEASKMGGSQIWFKEGETLTIDEALKCICVVSANDVCYAMAEKIGGTHDNFVNLMNERAKGLGMENTQFKNCHGIDEDGHYTTAKDIAIMSKELITKHPNIFKYTTIWMDSIRGGTFNLSNTNKLLKSYNGITGLKTGSTSQAGFNLSATATREGLSLIAVVLKAPTSSIRNEEVTALLNYGFSAYTSTKLGSKDEMISKIKINKNISRMVDVCLKKDEYLITKKGENNQCNKVVEIQTNLKAPINKGGVVGKVKFIDNESKVLYEADLIVNKNVNKSNLWDYIKKIINTYSLKEFKPV